MANWRDGESDPIRKHLLDLLRMKGAHLNFEETVGGFPAALRGIKPKGVPHSPWQLLEHLRIAQWDILDFSRNPDYKEMKFPDDYWPKTETPPDDTAWDQSIKHPTGPESHGEAVLPTPTPTSPPASPTATDRPSCAKPCSWPTTTPTTSAS